MNEIELARYKLIMQNFKDVVKTSVNGKEIDGQEFIERFIAQDFLETDVLGIEKRFK